MTKEKTFNACVRQGGVQCLLPEQVEAARRALQSHSLNRATRHRGQNLDSGLRWQA